jgi:hypothetical protein
MVKRIVVAASIALFLSNFVFVQPAVSRVVRLLKGTPVMLDLPDDIDAIADTNINVPITMKVSLDVVIGGDVVIERGALATGRASRVEHPIQLSVQSTKSVDKQNVGLTISGEPKGTQVNTYTTDDMLVSLPAVSQEVRLPRGTPVALRLSGDVYSTSNINLSLDIEVDRDVLIDGEVVIRRGTPVMGRASMEESFGMPGRGGRIQLSVQSTESVDRQSVGLMTSGEPMGTRADAYTTNDIRVRLPAVSQEVRLPGGTPVTLKLSDDIDSITNVDKPLNIEVERDVLIDGKVVIKSGTPARGRVSMVEHPTRISVQSTQTVDNQNVGLVISGEPTGKQVSACVTEDVWVRFP